MAVIHQALMIPSVIPILCFLWKAVRSGAASGWGFLLPAHKSQVSAQSRAALGVPKALGSMAWAAPQRGSSGEQMCCLQTSGQRPPGGTEGAQWQGHSPTYTPSGPGNIQDILMLKSNSLFT